MSKIKPLVFAAVTILHIALIMFAGFRAELPVVVAEPVAGVMRLVSVQEELPPPLPPLPPSSPRVPPPPERPPETPLAASEALAETFIETETDEISPPVAAVPANAPLQHHTLIGQNEYLRRHQISALPLLPEDRIARAVVYPRNARRLNIEGTVTLELFIDRQGAITDIRVIRETPLNRGFGEAAVNAFRGISALRPAELNGEPVAVRFQYNLRFALR